MANIKLVQATVADVPTLVEYRIVFLNDLLGAQPEEHTETLRGSLYAYYTQALLDKNYISILAKDGDTIASIGGMTIRHHPGSYKNLKGQTGYLMNMYTLPAYRRKGLCSRIVNELIAFAAAEGVTTFELHATKDGEPVYQKCGFEKHSEPTYRKFI